MSKMDIPFDGKYVKEVLIFHLFHMDRAIDGTYISKKDAPVIPF